MRLKKEKFQISVGLPRMLFKVVLSQNIGKSKSIWSRVSSTNPRYSQQPNEHDINVKTKKKKKEREIRTWKMFER